MAYDCGSAQEWKDEKEASGFKKMDVKTRGKYLPAVPHYTSQGIVFYSSGELHLLQLALNVSITIP